MYLLKVKGLTAQGDSTLTFETENKHLARSAYLLFVANGYEVVVLKEVDPKLVKFKGTS